ncbi:FixH family protein [Evansella sp. AB-rgal1]|uniref:FixH family protein n=1 Tax=Evansella sp. AB-rgal1 TaxID=3242696 RepID=UPI00359EAE75
MSRYWKIGLFVLSFIIFLTACGDSNNHQHGSQPELNFAPLEVEIIAPEEADPFEDVILQAFVTQGDEKVNDASEVLFEIWQRGNKDESEFVEADLTEEDGVYEIVYQFTEENLYFIQPHVTARDMHVMPVGEIIIGDVPEDILDEDHEEQGGHHDHGDHGHESHGGDHGHHELHEHMNVEWKSAEEVSVDGEVDLIVAIEWHGSPWSNGEVRFEIYQHGDEVHQWLDAEEVENGVYSLTHRFEDAGDYHVVIHIEDDELHEHVERKIIVVD